MTECELLRLCSNKHIKRSFAPIIYWTSEYYSFGKYIRKYGYYPRWLPLTVYSDHSGPSLTDIPYPHELNNNAPAFLTHSKLKAEFISNATGKTAKVMLSPAVFCRRLLGINPSYKACGTVAFPVHTLPNQREFFDIERYIKQLRQLPIEYQPVTVCLHMHDINKGIHKIYMSAGISVITAGNPADDRFIERIYKHISEHRYVTSNDVSTIAFFAIEMQIPFFIYGAEQKSLNVSDDNYKHNAVIEEFKNFPLYVFFRERLLFSAYHPPEITEEVHQKVNEILGVDSHIGRKEMSFLLWKSLFLWLFRGACAQWIRSILYKHFR